MYFFYIIFQSRQFVLRNFFVCLFIFVRIFVHKLIPLALLLSEKEKKHFTLKSTDSQDICFRIELQDILFFIGLKMFFVFVFICYFLVLRCFQDILYRSYTLEGPNSISPFPLYAIVLEAWS